MKKTKLLLVEDEPIAAALASKIIHQAFPNLHILGPAASVSEAMMLIEQHHPQILLLDIELTDGNAFELIRKIPRYPTAIIFMSAYQEYALEAISLTSMDFILKPFDINDLIDAIDKAIEEQTDDDNNLQMNTLLHNLRPQVQPLLYFTTPTEKISVPVSQIQWAQSIPGGCMLKTGHKIHKINRPLRRYEIILANHSFYRCHPHYLVNIRQIIKLDSAKGMLHIHNGDIIPFEPRKLNALVERLESTGKKTKSPISRLLSAKFS